MNHQTIINLDRRKQLRRYAYAGIAVHFALGGVLTYLLRESAKLEDEEAAAAAAAAAAE